MFRKIVFASIMAVLVLTSSIVPAFAQGTNPTPANHRWTTFQVAVNPTLAGFASDQAFGNAPVSFKNYLYDFVPEDIFNAQMPLKVIRSTDGKHWEYAGMPYPEDPRYNFVLGGFVYRDHLYIALTQNTCLGGEPIPGLVMRTANGKDWEKVFQAFGNKQVSIQTAQFGVFKGMLYLTTSLGHGQTGNAQIWRSRSGDLGGWELATAVFGNNNGYTSMLTEFKDHAYITSTDADGVHIWRSADGKHWNTVGQDLLNDPAVTNWFATNPVVFEGDLYVGTNPMFWISGVPGDYKGGQIYRSRDGVHWQIVVGHGFGGTQNPSGIDILLVYHDQLYALSNDLASDGWSWGITYVWRSRTGNPGDWVKVNPDGMGPNTEVGFSWEAIFKGDLYIGNGFDMGATTDLMKMVNP